MKHLKTLITLVSLLMTVNFTHAQCPNSAPFTATDLGGGLFQFTSFTNVPSGIGIEHWDFGDGVTASGSPVTHQYSNSGVVTVTLTVYDSLNTWWCATTSQVITVNSICNIQAQFSYTNLGNSQVQFTQTSVDNTPGSAGIVSTFWNFAPGQFSDITNPTHFFNAQGIYPVCMTVTNSIGCIDTVCTNVVVSNNACNFFPVLNIINQGNGNYVATYNWVGNFQFGSAIWNASNGQSFASPTALFNFNSPGIYDICLTMTDASGCVAVECDTAIITPANCSLVSTFTYTAGGPNTVNLFAAASGGTPPYQYLWNFGNGQIQTTNLTSTAYANNTPGTYLICLTVTDALGCTSQYCGNVVIQSNNCSNLTAICNAQLTSIQTVNYTVTPNGGTPPYSFNWQFSGGNPTSSTLQNPMVFYAAPGTYQGIVIVTDAAGCNFTCVANVEIPSGNSCSLILNPYNWQGISYLFFSINGANPSQIHVNWGDGTPVESYNLPVSNNYVMHMYPASGNYELCAWINDGTCTDTTCTIFYACLDEANFTYTNNGNNSYTFTIQDYNPSNQYFWTIGNSYIAATGPSTNFDFTFGGPQNVCLQMQGLCFDSTCYSINVELVNPDTISGYLWNDVNGNGLWDSGEPALTSGYVYLCSATNPQNCLWGWVDSNGHYQFIVAAGSYTLTSNYWAQNTIQTYPYNPTTYSFTTNGGQNISGFNFGYQNQSIIICGVVYYDTNGNGVQDAGESGVANTHVKINGIWYYTNNNGQYHANVTAGNYTITYTNTPAGFSITQPSSGTYSVNATQIGQTYCNNNFGIYADPSLQNLTIDIIPYTTVTPGFPAWYYIKYCNNGVFSMNGTVTFQWDAGLNATGSSNFSVSPTTLNIAGHTATWDFNNLQPGECKYIFVNLVASTSLVLGSNTVELAMIEPIMGDAFPLNNVDTLHQVVVGSWDPNAKEVSPGVGPEGYVHPNTKLNYTIHFQNMGTAPAVNIIVIDTLSNLLDWNSLSMHAASHNYTLEFDANTGIAIWYFNNIMLPDSGSDYQGSMGAINFSINQKPNLANGTVINNLADIYFDFNEPVRTNTAKSTINTFVGVEPRFIENLVSVFPNPVHDAAIFLNQSTNGGELHLVIRNVVGQIVENSSIPAKGSYRFNRNNLPSGVYLYEVISRDGKSAQGKLVIE